MPPQDPNLPEGTDSIIDGTADLRAASGSGVTGTSSAGYGSSGLGSSGLGSSGMGSSGLSSSGMGSAGADMGSSAGSFMDDEPSSLGSDMSNVARSAGSGTDVQSLKAQASDKARDVASQGKERAAEALDSVSRMVSETADTVDERLGPQYGNYVRKAADALDGFNDSIRNKQVDELFDDARNLVRQSPAVAIGAAAAIGFLLVRLVRSGMPASAGSDDDYYASSLSSTAGIPPRVDNSYDPVA